MASLRDLGEHCALVLSIYDGKFFKTVKRLTMNIIGRHFCLSMMDYHPSLLITGKDFTPPDEQCQIYVVASLESKEVILTFEF